MRGIGVRCIHTPSIPVLKPQTFKLHQGGYACVEGHSAGDDAPLHDRVSQPSVSHFSPPHILLKRDQHNCNPKYWEKVDMYALGITLLEMMHPSKTETSTLLYLFYGTSHPLETRSTHLITETITTKNMKSHH